MDRREAAAVGDELGLLRVHELEGRVKAIEPGRRRRRLHEGRLAARQTSVPASKFVFSSSSFFSRYIREEGSKAKDLREDPCVDVSRREDILFVFCAVGLRVVLRSAPCVPPPITRVSVHFNSSHGHIENCLETGLAT